MKKIIIDESQRGFLFKNGKYIKMLTPGGYKFFGRSYSTFVVQAYGRFDPSKFDLCVFENDPEVMKCLDIIDVKDGEVVVYYENGCIRIILERGRYAFWNIGVNNEYKTVDIMTDKPITDIPPYILAEFDTFTRKVNVPVGYVAGITIDGKTELYNEGVYYFWSNGKAISTELLPVKRTECDISGQEMLTLDKVTIRINFNFRYKITDYLAIFNEYSNHGDQLRTAVQLAIREYVGKNTLDAILENRDGISSYVTERMTEREGEFFIKVAESGVKDIILPGEIRDIMNTVLIAEKQAQANVITRREEVASTRSLLNTAKLLEDNPTLYKLKEMEYIEKICEKVGSISVTSNADILSQLAKIAGGKQ